MPTESLLDFNYLLSPLPGDDPAGEPVEFGVKKDLESSRKPVPEELAGPDNPARPEDWRKIIRLATKTLGEKSKDLLVAARLTEALVKQHGFPGLADGLTLLRRMSEECWDRMHPRFDPADPDSLEDRAGPYNWIGDAATGARLPGSVRTTPLIMSSEGPVSLEDMKPSVKERKAMEKEDIDKALASTTAESCNEIAEATRRSLEELRALLNILGVKLGNSAPAMLDLRDTLAACNDQAQLIAKYKSPSGGGADADDAGASDSGSGSGTGSGTGGAPRSSGGRIASRADAYRRLEEAAMLLQELEPHSPIPYLIRRAVELGAMSFPDLMRALIRNGDVLTEMNRELGIKQGGSE